MASQLDKRLGCVKQLGYLLAWQRAKTMDVSKAALLVKKMETLTDSSLGRSLDGEILKVSQSASTSDSCLAKMKGMKWKAIH